MFCIRIWLYLLNLLKKKNRKFNNPNKIESFWKWISHSNSILDLKKFHRDSENTNKQIIFILNNRTETLRFSLCNCHSIFFKKSVSIILNLISQLQYFIFQGSKRYLSKTKFPRKELDSRARFHLRMELASSFLPSTSF